MSKKKTEKVVDKLTLFDDDLMSRVFDGNLEATELLLRIILGRKDITVHSSIGQKTIKNPHVDGRNITLDIRASGNDHREFDVEVQRNSTGSNIKRARYHSSMMDSELLKATEEFKDIRDSYVIFICAHDKFHKNKPIYHIDRIVRESGNLFKDGSHIIYVNGKYKGEDMIGKLIHDFHCLRSKDMYFKPLADGVHHFKETKEGRKDMCTVVERYAREEARKETEKLRIVIASKDQALSEKDNALAEQNKILAEQRFEIERLKKALSEK